MKARRHWPQTAAPFVAGIGLWFFGTGCGDSPEWTSAPNSSASVGVASATPSGRSSAAPSTDQSATDSAADSNPSLSPGRLIAPPTALPPPPPLPTRSVRASLSEASPSSDPSATAPREISDDRVAPVGGQTNAESDAADTSDQAVADQRAADKPAADKSNSAAPRRKGAKPNPLRGPDAETEAPPTPSRGPNAKGNNRGGSSAKPSTAPTKPAAAKTGASQPAGDEPPKGKPASPPAGGIDNPGAKQGVARLPLFEGWAKPDAAIVLTGRQNGYIEPCGCAGLSVQKGGLARRLTMIRELSGRGWPVAPLDVGNQIKRSGRQSEIKFQRTIDGLRAMDYRAIGFGPDDLKLAAGDLFSAASEEPLRFVSANVTILSPDAAPPFRVIELGGLKIGVTAVLGDDYVRQRSANDEIAARPAEQGLAEAAPQLKAAKCDWQVLLVYGSMDETRKLAAKFPQFHVVVTAGGAEEPAFEPEVLGATETRLVQVGAKGMYAGVIGFYRQGKPRLRYQRVPLDDRFADSPEMLELLAGYQDQLREAGLDGLELRETKHPSGKSFVGSEKCGECHTKSFEKWSSTGHAKATETLVHPAERSEIPRHHDPECLSCHVTGWEPQKMFPFKSGYLGLKETPHLVANGCENCHGPGSAHVAAEEGQGNPTAAVVTQRRGEMRLPLAKAFDKCNECHDHDNSPKFHLEGAFEEYWKRIAHPGKD